MSDAIFEILREMNIGQLLAIGAMLCFFYRRLDSKIDKLESKMNQRFERLEAKVEDIDRRLCRIEGSLATQGHCLFSQGQTEKKAE